MMMMRRRMTTTSFWISVDARSQNYNPNGLFVSAYHLINYPIDHTYYPSVGNLLNKIKVEQRHSFISNLRSFSCKKKINDEIMMMMKIMLNHEEDKSRDDDVNKKRNEFKAEERIEGGKGRLHRASCLYIFSPSLSEQWRWQWWRWPGWRRWRWRRHVFLSCLQICE